MAILNNNLLVEPTLVLPTFNFSPIAGPLGTEVVISGNALSKPVSSVLFNGVAASRFQDPSNPANIVAIVPANATSGPITLRFSDGSSLDSIGTFDVLPGIANPKIRNFFPTSGPAGTFVQLDGSGFTQATAVTFGGVPATNVNIQADTNIIVQVPQGAVDGPITVSRNGVSGSSTTSFDVTSGFGVTSFTPISGISGGVCSIFGNGFLGVDTVLFGNASAIPFSIFSDGRIDATIPAGLPGTVVQITLRKGTQQMMAPGFFTYASTGGLSLSSFSPLSGPVGTLVTLTGTNLSEVTAVRFGGVPAAFTILSATQIRATVPSGAVDGPISVQDSTGLVQSATTFDVTTSTYSVTSLTPASGTVGAQVTISGSGLLGTDTVLFGAFPAAFTVLSDTSLLATAPSGPSGTVAVSVRKAGQAAIGNLSFTYGITGGLTISSFAPTSGPVGTAVTINGTNLSGVDQVQFGGVNASFTINSASRITAIVPAGAVDGFITLNDNGLIARSATIFDVTTGFTVTSVNPSSGAAGSSVIINGSGFIGVNSVLFGPNIASFTVIDDTRISAVVPNGTNGTTVAIIVTKNGVNAGGNVTFTYGVTNTLAVTGIMPNIAAAGALVRIIGTGLATVIAVRVGRFRVPFTLVNDSELRITAQLGITGQVTVFTATSSATSADVLQVI